MEQIPVERLSPIELPPILVRRREEAKDIIEAGGSRTKPWARSSYFLALAAGGFIASTVTLLLERLPVLSALLTLVGVVGAVIFSKRPKNLDVTSMQALGHDAGMTKRWAKDFISVTAEIDALNADMHDVLVYVASYASNTVFCEKFIARTVRLAEERDRLEGLLMALVRNRADITVNRMMDVRTAAV